MREINNFFREGDEPEMSRDDSANSVVVVKIDGSGFAPEQIINSQMLSGIEALLDTPQIIKEFHSMLHPLTEMIHEHESRGIHNWMKSFLKMWSDLRNFPAHCTGGLENSLVSTPPIAEIICVKNVEAIVHYEPE